MESGGTCEQISSGNGLTGKQKGKFQVKNSPFCALGKALALNYRYNFAGLEHCGSYGTEIA